MSATQERWERKAAGKRRRIEGNDRSRNSGTQGQGDKGLPSWSFIESEVWDWPGDQGPTLLGSGKATAAWQGNCRVGEGTESGVGPHNLKNSGAQVLSLALTLPFPSLSHSILDLAFAHIGGHLGDVEDYNA